MNCVFLHHQDPFLKMGPFKYEYLNKGPNVGLVHDLISKEIIEKIKLNARHSTYIRTVRPYYHLSNKRDITPFLYYVTVF